MWEQDVIGSRQRFEPKDLRNALGRFATGVCVMTTVAKGGKREGLTVNSFASLSLSPAMILWSAVRHSPSAAAFEAAPFFAVNVLAADQRDVSARFAKPAYDKFDGLEGLSFGAGGCPLLPGTVAHFECRRQFGHYGGDHILFVGSVERFEAWDRRPLLFFGGSYAEMAAADGVSPQAKAPADNRS